MPVLSGGRELAAGTAAGREAHGEALLAGPSGDSARRPSTPMRAEIFPVCSNPHCASGWLRLWRRRDSPVFEGGWCCSAQCVAERVESAFRREMDGRGEVPMVHRHRIPIGLTMLEQGWITQAQLRAALEAQRVAGAGRLGHWLVRLKSVSEDRVTRALGLQWSCPVLGTEFHGAKSLTALLPRLFVDAFGVLPLHVVGQRMVYLGFEERPDAALTLAVERMTGLRVESGVVAESAFRPAHGSFLETRFPAVELIEAATASAMVAAFTKVVERVRPTDARLVRVHECLWLRLWLRPQRGALPDLDSIRDVIGSAAQ
jgi:hypothetical protein